MCTVIFNVIPASCGCSISCNLKRKSHVKVKREAVGYIYFAAEPTLT